MARTKGLTPPYTDDELAGIIGNEIDTAGNFAADFMEENRRQAWAYYLGRTSEQRDQSATTDVTGYSRQGRSEAVSEDVADMVEGLMATLMPSFGSDVPAEFEPTGENDEEAASAESDAVANVLMEGIKDCLLLRNGTIKCWIQERTITERRRFKNISSRDIAMLMAATPEGVTPRLAARKGNGATITLTRTERTPKVEAIQQAHFLVDPNWRSIFIDGIPFCAER